MQKLVNRQICEINGNFNLIFLYIFIIINFNTHLQFMKTTAFSALLLNWHLEKNQRQMPWKGESDPYKVWLSEIILQQTRVEQGTSYYTKFIKNFPDIFALAKSKDEKVFKLWEGLGYYARCKNMLATARFIAFDRAGKFPENFEDLLKLKGIGPYTASAIASFCYNLPKPVIDGNVYRVLSRIYKIKESPDTVVGKKYFAGLAAKLIDKKHPGLYNQAIMDFGATVCKPALPLCNSCVYKKFCGAYLENNVMAYPVKLKKITKRERWFSYFIFYMNEKVFVQKRTARDIWQNLFEFYLKESEKPIKWTELKVEKYIAGEFGFKEKIEISIHSSEKQILTHQVIHAVFIHVQLENIPNELLKNKGKWLRKKQLRETSFPVIIRKHMENSIMLS